LREGGEDGFWVIRMYRDGLGKVMAEGLQMDFLK
jgi:hypothetical protein